MNRPALRGFRRHSPGGLAEPRPPHPVPAPLLSLVLPTYNEAENLPCLLPRLAGALDSAGVPFEIIVVDDDSPDGTWARAAQMAHRDPRLRVIRRRGERGLATAVVAGWKTARGEILGVMDADLQYPPEGLPGLLRVLGDDPALDVVVASRYGPGASRGPWSARRHLVSRAAIGLAKLALPRALGQLRDPNAGYFLLRRRVIQDVDLRPLGYKILIEVLARGRWHRMREIPQDYQERPAGTSKLGVRQSVEFVVHVARLAWETRVIPAAAAGHRPWPPRALR